MIPSPEHSGDRRQMIIRVILGGTREYLDKVWKRGNAQRKGSRHVPVFMEFHTINSPFLNRCNVLSFWDVSPQHKELVEINVAVSLR